MEALEHEKDQQKVPESPVSSSSSVRGSNWISIQTSFPWQSCHMDSSPWVDIEK